jgi:hypothetical protein
MVGSGAPARNELVPHAPREREVSDGSVQMTKLPSAEPELDSSEAMVVGRDPLPAGDGSADGLYCRARCQHLAFIRGVCVSARDRMSLTIHGGGSSLFVERLWIKGPPSSALEVKPVIQDTSEEGLRLWAFELERATEQARDITAAAVTQHSVKAPLGIASDILEWNVAQEDQSYLQAIWA